VLEAMASKTLVLSSNRTSLPEVYGRHALYFNPDNLNEIIKIIHKVVNLKSTQRIQQINQAYSHAQSFSWEKTAQLTLAAYETCFRLRSNQ
ncbi:MAG: glycosyltransferase, partial [Patescibacteria group bacterium]|nr:glycosyltransferase [Patescibacteria group bacterium]